MVAETVNVESPLPVVLAWVGVFCDLLGEARFMSMASEHAYLEILDAQTAIVLTAGVANGLYTAGGIMLMVATPGLPDVVRLAMHLTWWAGLGMTVSGVLTFAPGLVFSSAILFPLFVLWVTWMGLKWRPGE